MALHSQKGTTTPAVAHHARLYRRLLIQCPVTARPVDTGLELTELHRLASGGRWLLDCQECGQDHDWKLDDLIVE